VGYSHVDFKGFNGLVVFHLVDQLFCTNIDDVFAIVNPADFPENVKNSFLVKSNLDLENYSIPIIGLHTLFGLKNGKITPISRFICVEKYGHVFAFIADKVEELILLDDRTRNEFQFIEIKTDKYLSGKVKHNKDVFRLPNFETIINESFVHY
jgi:chemotaxis signal transduction protein